MKACSFLLSSQKQKAFIKVLLEKNVKMQFFEENYHQKDFSSFRSENSNCNVTAKLGGYELVFSFEKEFLESWNCRKRCHLRLNCCQFGLKWYGNCWNRSKIVIEAAKHSETKYQIFFVCRSVASFWQNFYIFCKISITTSKFSVSVFGRVFGFSE